MEGFVDVHCHLLPGIDDGSKNMEMTMKMIKIAYEEGIRHMITTPHYHPRRGEADADVIDGIFGQTRSMIRAVYPDMEIYEGNEIYYRQDAKNMLKTGQLLTLAGSDYVLVEFSLSSGEADEMLDAVRELQMAGYLPVIAHIERYDRVLGDLQSVEDLVEAGAYIQVNAGSVTGEAGGSTKRFAKKLIKENLVHFVGSDAHDVMRRPPLLKKCAASIAKKFGEDTAQQLFFRNPYRVIQNQLI